MLGYGRCGRAGRADNHLHIYLLSAEVRRACALRDEQDLPTGYPRNLLTLARLKRAAVVGSVVLFCVLAK